MKTKVNENETGNYKLEIKVTNNRLTTESSINNLKTKVDGIDLTKYVLKSDYDTKVGNLELKIPDASGLLQTSYNIKVNELENKIKTAEQKPDISNLANKTELKNVENKIPDSNAFVKKTDYATEITSIKNDYVTNAALTSQLNDLKTPIDHNKSVINDLEREASFGRGFYYYTQQSYFLFEPKSKSFSRNGWVVNSWISTGIHNDSNNTDLFSVNNSSNNSPTLLNQNNRLGVTFNGNYMKQNKLGYAYVYSLKNRTVNSPDLTVQNGLLELSKLQKIRNFKL